MPGALHRPVFAIDVAFAERPAAMRANIVEREIFAVQIEQGDGAAFDLNHQPLPRGEVRRLRYLNKFRHSDSSQPNLAAIVYYMS